MQQQVTAWCTLRFYMRNSPPLPHPPYGYCCASNPTTYPSARPLKPWRTRLSLCVGVFTEPLYHTPQVVAAAPAQTTLGLVQPRQVTLRSGGGSGGDRDESGSGGGGGGGGSGEGEGVNGSNRALFSKRRTPATMAQRWTEEQSLRLRRLVEERQLVAKSGAKDWTNIAKKVDARGETGIRGREAEIIRLRERRGEGSCSYEIYEVCTAGC